MTTMQTIIEKIDSNTKAFEERMQRMEHGIQNLAAEKKNTSRLSKLLSTCLHWYKSSKKNPFKPFNIESTTIFSPFLNKVLMWTASAPAEKKEEIQIWNQAWLLFADPRLTLVRCIFAPWCSYLHFLAPSPALILKTKDPISFLCLRSPFQTRHAGFTRISLHRKIIAKSDSTGLSILSFSRPLFHCLGFVSSCLLSLPLSQSTTLSHVFKWSVCSCSACLADFSAFSALWLSLSHEHSHKNELLKCFCLPTTATLPSTSFPCPWLWLT